MTIVNQVIDVYRGDSAMVEVALTDALGAAYDPTIPGVTVEWRMSRTAYSPTLVRKASGNAAVSATVGMVSIGLTAADTDVAPGEYYHQLSVFDGSDVYTAMTGIMRVRRANRVGALVALRITASPPRVAVSP